MGFLLSLGLTIGFFTLAVEGLRKSTFTRKQNVQSLIGLLVFLVFNIVGLGSTLYYMPNIPAGTTRSDAETLTIFIFVFSYIALSTQALIAYTPKGPDALITSNSVSRPLFMLNLAIVILFGLGVLYWWY